jgi:hypothetical protein
VNRTGSGSCPVTGFAISGAEPTGPTTKEFDITEEGRGLSVGRHPDPVQQPVLAPVAQTNART